ncbi:MAG: type II toxin-antitoxin system HigB family toxin [Pirellulales bacterium]
MRYTDLVHVISRTALRLFWEKYPDSKAPLNRWFQIVRRTNFTSFAELRQTFPSADVVDRFTVCNIAGNKYRLVAPIQFNRGKVYIRHVLTHREYDDGAWKP